MSGEPVAVDVVIPAQNEEELLPACLGSLVAQRDVGPINLVVVANGCQDRTAAVAEIWRPAATDAGHRLIVLERGPVGKAGAINVADGLLCGGVHVYLDADVVLTAGALAELVAALPADRPRLASPTPAPRLPDRGLAAGYARVWSALPSIVGDVTGLGCYAVSRAGRRRWTRLPPVIADDAFVRARFAPDERVVVDGAHFLFSFPERPALVPVLARWREGNRELRRKARADDPGAPAGRVLRSLAGRPALWPDLPAFLTVSAMVRARLWRRSRRPRVTGPAPWPRAPRPALTPPTLAARRVCAVVVTHDSADQIDACIARLRSALAGVAHEIVVVDNASRDGTAERLGAHAAIEVQLNAGNVGFGAAVNQAARAVEGGYLLLVNPDAELERDTVETLLAVAGRFPQAGLYGGQAILASGSRDPFSRLPAPGLVDALAFAAGTPSLRWRWAHRRAASAAVRGTTAVPALCGALVLIDVAAWRELGGFDERFVMYGEDVDLCRRALARGYRPLHVAAATYRHAGGASSSSVVRHRLMLTANVDLCRRHVDGWRRPAAIAALAAGVALRAAVSATLPGRGHDRVWPQLWRERRRWLGGWDGALDPADGETSPAACRMGTGGFEPPTSRV